MSVTALRDRYDPLTEQELGWYDDIWTRLSGEFPNGIRASIIGAELVKRGLLPERADIVMEHAGNPQRPTTRLGMVIAAFSHMPTHILHKFIEEYAPGSSMEEIIGELRRQAAAHDAEAGALEVYAHGREVRDEG